MNRALTTVALTFALIAVSRPAAAQGVGLLSDGITVSGTGQTMVKPNKLEIDIRASAAAELSADAVVKYRGALRRAKETIEKLKIENLQVIDRGLSVSSTGLGSAQMGYVAAGPFDDGGNAPARKQETAVSKSQRLTVSGVDKLSEEQLIALVAKILDGVKDAGLIAGVVDPNNPNEQSEGQMASTTVMFIADDIGAARKQATEAAFAKAKEKAQQIAELAGGRLGAAAAVDEISSGDGEYDPFMGAAVPSYYYRGATSSGDTPRLTSAALIDLPVRVNLRVRFALQPSGGAK